MAINIAPKSIDTELSELMRVLAKPNYQNFKGVGLGMMDEFVGFLPVCHRGTPWEPL